MNTPSPLIPQGSFQGQTKGRSNVQLAVITIVAIHVVFFGGLLLQGCKRNTQLAGNTATNSLETNVTDTLSYAPLINDTNAGMYYTNPQTLPTSTGATGVASPGSATTPDYGLGTTSTPNNNFESSALPGSSNIGLGATPSTVPPEAPAQIKEYTVAKGDSFYKIAKAHNTTVAALTKANPNIEPSRLRAGAKINVPVGEARPASTTVNGTGAAVTGGSGQGTVYTVKSGDTLTRIARNHGTTVSALRAANGLKVSRLLVGQKIKIPSSTRTNTEANANGVVPAQPTTIQ
jgi:LysM repeat protein